MATNYAPNPTIEVNADGWVNNAGSEVLTRSTEQAHGGVASLKVVDATSGAWRGVQPESSFRNDLAITQGQTAYISAFVYPLADPNFNIGAVELSAGLGVLEASFGAEFPLLPLGMWTEATREYVAVNAACAFVYPVYAFSNACTFYLDDFWISDEARPPASSPAIRTFNVRTNALLRR